MKKFLNSFAKKGTLKNGLLILTLVALLSACGGEPVELTTTSPDGKTTLHVQGKKATAFDPYRVNVWISTAEFTSPPAEFELYANDFTEKEVVFEWDSPSLCYVTFKQRDGELLQYALSISNKQMSFRKI